MTTGAHLHLIKCRRSHINNVYLQDGYRGIELAGFGADEWVVDAP